MREGLFYSTRSLLLGQSNREHVTRININTNININIVVAEWYGAELALARSRVRIPPTAAVYQRQLSVPSLRARLMSTSERWGVNGHTR